LGEALFESRELLPTLRTHNEQAMALAAVTHEGVPAASHDGL
jgi:TPP-dependent trihydroxycyclohexane-1,2-dione (THcHDO) dehydratase